MADDLVLENPSFMLDRGKAIAVKLIDEYMRGRVLATAAVPYQGIFLHVEAPSDAVRFVPWSAVTWVEALSEEEYQGFIKAQEPVQLDTSDVFVNHANHS
jgi:hypothetical protein